ncbi:hypothetical protein VP01_4621g1 [Puccinia sorghi]|uniref:Integrase catalytic domain-containing protein n=1 Tax=Puccinia sorghi TaxID=27349 RepID=A0A0L6UP77_9BASI|nr:hypothetical protein VP01_4621g1 [Puccinia sorghi]
MVSDKNLFISIDETKNGLINTSCGSNTLEIKGKGLIAGESSLSFKASYKHRSSRASKPFKEFHLDLIGPISTPSYQGHRFILTIVDGCSRFCSAIPIKAKSDVFSILTFAIDSEVKCFGYHPSIIHSDQGTEFINSSLEEYCREHRIQQRFSNAYTPQQNGLAEQFNRTILESLRTILYDSGFRHNLWSEVIHACLLTLNQVPSHQSKKSP